MVCSRSARLWWSAWVTIVTQIALAGCVVLDSDFSGGTGVEIDSDRKAVSGAASSAAVVQQMATSTIAAVNRMVSSGGNALQTIPTKPHNPGTFSRSSVAIKRGVVAVPAVHVGSAGSGICNTVNKNLLPAQDERKAAVRKAALEYLSGAKFFTQLQSLLDADFGRERFKGSRVKAFGTISAGIKLRTKWQKISTGMQPYEEARLIDYLRGVYVPSDMQALEQWKKILCDRIDVERQSLAKKKAERKRNEQENLDRKPKEIAATSLWKAGSSDLPLPKTGHIVEQTNGTKGNLENRAEDAKDAPLSFLSEDQAVMIVKIVVGALFFLFVLSVLSYLIALHRAYAKAIVVFNGWGDYLLSMAFAPMTIMAMAPTEFGDMPRYVMVPLVVIFATGAALSLLWAIFGGLRCNKGFNAILTIGARPFTVGLSIFAIAKVLDAGNKCYNADKHSRREITQALFMFALFSAVYRIGIKPMIGDGTYVTSSRMEPLYEPNIA